MVDRIQIGDKWYVAATSGRGDERAHVLKNNETFVLFDRRGDIQSVGQSDHGLYHGDTRFLSHQELLIDGVRPLYLNSTVKEDNSLLIVELMNPDLGSGSPPPVPKGTVHIFRAKLLWKRACYEHVRVSNHGLNTVSVMLTMPFAVDFADVFEVRGMSRARRGTSLPAEVGASEVTLAYCGLDNLTRRTRVSFDPAPSALDQKRAQFDLTLPPKAEVHLYCSTSCEVEDQPHVELRDYPTALRENNAARESLVTAQCRIETSNALFNFWLARSASDLAMLTTALPTGPYPYAGVPWYSTTFGRDGILTASEYLWIDPALARGVLAFLAATQATHEDAERDAEPGKILHEARRGEMAHTNEIPFGRYYGSVDATPLFVGLAGAYYRRTGDLDFVRSIWHNIRLALDWIDRYGDLDGDGFVEYARRSSEGLVQQGWKDSQDSVFHSDGTLAEPPIALCEVQGYVYEAKLEASELARHLHEDDLADRLKTDAHELKTKFQRAFWCEEIGTYALALDGDKRQCQVPASNAGHALWSGIASTGHAGRITQGLVTGEFFSGWGVRTIPCGQSRYNPMSYHNGSVWPHDNAIIAAGMARYGHTAEAMTLLSGLFDASLFLDQHRLPELFCGFPRRPSEGPTLYPVACSPQAWASAAVFGMVQACLGVSFHPGKPEILLRSPRLPESIAWMRIRNLAIGENNVDLLLQRYENNVGIEVTRKQGRIEISVAI